MKKILMYITDTIFWILAWLCIPLFNCINYLFEPIKYRYGIEKAKAIDIFGNEQYAPMLNAILIKKDGYKFGVKGEYISGVLGKNILINKLTIAGKILVSILTEKHCIDAIKTEI